MVTRAECAEQLGYGLERGFVHAGTIRQAGYTFDRWLYLTFYQLILDTPESPVDGYLAHAIGKSLPN